MMKFFFLKQKTAYGMRISDWSSDVCSSDLLPRGKVQARRHGGSEGTPSGPPARRAAALSAHERAAGQTRDRRSGRHHLDRKSDVKGTSVSVRVDLGGRCIIKIKLRSSSSHLTKNK